MATAKSPKPEIKDLPPETVAVITTKGDPNVVAQTALQKLFGAVYALKLIRLKEGKPNFKVTGLRARWPDAHILPKDQWTGNWALPIPEGTTELPPDLPHKEVRI